MSSPEPSLGCCGSSNSVPEQSSRPSRGLQVEQLSAALSLLSLAAKRGAFPIEEFEQVSSVYTPLKAFLSEWQEAITKKKKESIAAAAAQ